MTPPVNRRRFLTLAGGAAIASIPGVAEAAIPPGKTTVDYTLIPSADTYNNYANKVPTTTVGQSVRFSVQGDTNYWRHAFLRFNPTIPAGETVAVAKLQITVDSKTGTGGIDLYQTQGGWTEDGLNWNNAPVTGAFIGKKVCPAAGGVVEWDVTSLVTASTAEINFALQTGDPGYYGFNSAEAVDATRRPRLVITTNVTAPPPPPVDGDGTTAAVTLNWGTSLGGDEFDTGTVPDPAKWSVYDSAGHAGNGLRAPSQITIQDGYVRIAGDADGKTGGMSAKYPGSGARYGRWEIRCRASDVEPAYHPVGILWPDSGNWPCDGEVDYVEKPGNSTGEVAFYNHYSCTNQQTQTRKPHNWAEWHNFAVDVSEAGVKGYIDGVEWFSDTNTAHLPPGPMHQTLQLDWFPPGAGTPTTPSTFDVAWVRQYQPGVVVPPPAGGDVVFACVGDMNPNGNTSATSNSYKNGAAISTALANGQVNYFLGLGDFQYDIGAAGNFVTGWAKGWSGTKAKCCWISAPNHDWQPGRNADLANFMNGQYAGSTQKSYTNQQKGFVDNGQPYSLDFGSWHIAFLSTALWRYDTTAAKAVTTWLDNDLTAAKAAGKFLGVCYHDPYFTSTTSDHAREASVKPWIDIMWKHRVKFTLSGSQHNYERSHPVNNADQLVGDGMTAFQVSTGGIGLRAFTSNPSYIAKKFSDTWGWLKLTLRVDGSFAWQFMPVTGSNTDAGTRA